MRTTRLGWSIEASKTSRRCKNSFDSLHRCCTIYFRKEVTHMAKRRKAAKKGGAKKSSKKKSAKKKK